MSDLDIKRYGCIFGFVLLPGKLMVHFINIGKVCFSIPMYLQI